MKGLILFFIFSYLPLSLAQDAKSLRAALKSEETFEEKEQKIIDYTNIKDVLKNDGLTKQKIKREKLVKQIAVERRIITQGKHDYPNEENFWSFISEFWLVKNAQLVAWDFPKPEYGIKGHFKSLLEELGFYNKSFKVLIVNTPRIVHFGIPANKDEYIFLISLPFMRTLDLTKEDISLMLLEDFFRLEEKYFLKNLNADVSFLGKNFFKKEFEKKKINNILLGYSKIIFEQGFSFQQQYDVTKRMDNYLRSKKKRWEGYLKLLKKIQKVVKKDILYKDYTKIYPSPDLQIQWILPKKPVL